MKLVTQPTCRHCHDLKEMFDREGILYEEVDLTSNTNDSKKARLVARSNKIKVTPFIMYEQEGYTVVVTYDDILKKSTSDLMKLSRL